MQAPRFRLQRIEFAERDVALRLPFRFGAATVTACPQVHARVWLAMPGGRSAVGCAAEMMVPKWFDKDPALSHEQNFEQLRTALRLARSAYTADAGALTAWGHFAAHARPLAEAGASAGLQPLVSAYGPALVDRAILDALCLDAGVGFARAMRANLGGIAPRGSGLAPDLDGVDIDAFLAAREPRRSIAARHTVGLADAIRDADAPADAPRDGLPVSLEGAVRRYCHTHFKLKLGGALDADIERLCAIAAVIGPVAELVTLDGNEQYPDGDAFAAFLDRALATPALRTLMARTAFVEQPLKRDTALARDLGVLAARVPLLIDESDATLDAFVRAQALGYTGVSSKSCKNFHKSVLNAARCAAAPGRGLFLSGEDLTMQAGVAVQQDLALVGWLGLSHVERNGHHYVNGMAALPAAEQAAFLAMHPGLYEHSDGAARLRIAAGRIDLSTPLAVPGFATGDAGAGISWDAMRSVY